MDFKLLQSYINKFYKFRLENSSRYNKGKLFVVTFYIFKLSIKILFTNNVLKLKWYSYDYYKKQLFVNINI